MLKSMLSMSFVDEIIHQNDLEEDALNLALLTYIEKKKLSAIRQHSASKRRYRQRKSWANFASNLTDRQFRRYFRMTRECFQHLCSCYIESNVGERVFKSEEYLKDLRFSRDTSDNKTIKMLYAHEGSTGGFVSGEVKLGLTLRLLAGGSYLDLALLYEVGPSYAYEIFHDVVKNWLLDKRLVNIHGIEYVTDEERLEKVAMEFARSSNGLFNGCIGAIDGWIVKIRKPTDRPQRQKNIKQKLSLTERA